MSKKSSITSLLSALSKEWKSMDEKVKDIYANNGYTQAYKEELAEAERAKLNRLLEQVKEKIVSSIDSKLESMFKPVENTFNAAYQSRLTNVLNIVSLAGNNIDLRDLKAMIEPFQGDYTALEAIKAAITNCGIDKKENFPTVLSSLATGSSDTRKVTHEKLVKFKNSISEFNIDRSMGNIEWVQGMDYLGYDPFLNVLDDDLDYIGDDQFKQLSTKGISETLN